MMISVIIPTLNEENYLLKLLECIRQQTYKNYEIIVADGNSTDKTREIAKNYDCKIVLEPKGEKGHPGKARNLGAAHAKGDILLFVDADSQIEYNFFRNAIEEITNKKLDVAGVYLSPIERRIIDRVLLGAFNFWSFMTQLFYPHAAGLAIFCKKWLHQKIEGFDETIKLAEDMDYVRRCGKYGKFRNLKSVKVYVSMRRFDNEGRVKLPFKLLISGIYRLIFGAPRTDIFKYHFDYKK